MQEKEYNVDHYSDEAIIENYCKDVCIVQGIKNLFIKP